MSDNKEWEERFETQLPQAILGALEYRGFNDCGKYIDPTLWEHIKPLITDALSRVREETIAKSQASIGFLRQWLNEDRITDPNKMVTNEDLRHWLFETDFLAEIVRVTKQEAREETLQELRKQ